MASMKVRGAKERPETTQKITHSRFTTTPSSVWDNAGITLRQAMLLEYLFLMPSGRATYKDLAAQYDTSPINVGRSVGALARRGMVRRVGEQAVTVDRAAWRLRITYAAWDAWLTAETRQTAHERYGLLR
jgi:DNA-binding MarR family transcriptional regulator